MKAALPKPAASVLAVLFILCAEVFYFRNLLGNGSMPGDNGDGRFCMLVTEHWFRTLKGLDSFLRLPIFYPEKNALAWSDMLLGYAPVHSLLRLLGFSPHQAFKGTLIAVHGLGCLGMFALLRRIFRLGYIPAVCGALILGHAQLVVPSRHPQLFAMGFIPITFYALISCCLWIRRASVSGIFARRPILFWGLSFAVLAGSLPYTTYYLAAFFYLFLAAFAFFALVIASSTSRGRASLRSLLSFSSGQRLPEILLCAGVFILTVVPFLVFEVPERRIFGGRSWEKAASMLLTIPGLLNVFDENLIFGWMRGWLNLPSSHELQVGWLPPAAALFIFAFCQLFAVCIRSGRAGRALCPRISAIIAVTAAAVLMTLSGTKTQSGFSLWRIAYDFIPGADAMRAVSRIHVFLVFPAAIAAAWGAQRLITLSGSRRLLRAGMVSVLFAAVVLSSIWTKGVQSRWTEEWDRGETESFLAPPAYCSAIILEDSGRRRHYRYPWEYQLASWSAANRFNLPTISGYSGQFPKSWQMEQLVGSAIAPAADHWTDLNGLDGVCAYDLFRKTWRRTGKANSRRDESRD